MSKLPQFPGSTPYESPLRIVAIAGSVRRDSLNRRLLEAAAELASPAMEIVVYRALDEIPFFNEDLEAAFGGPGPVRELRAMVRGADGLLLATPEYNQSFSGVIKNALDWLSRGGAESALRGKPAAIVGVTTGQWGTRLAQSALRQVLAASGSLVLPTASVFVRNGSTVFDADGSLVDEGTRSALHALLNDFEDWIRRLSPDAFIQDAAALRRVGAA